MGSDHQSIVHVVVVVERAWKVPVHPDDGFGRDPPGRRPRLRRPIGEDLVGTVARTPGDCRECADHASPVFVGPNDS